MKAILAIIAAILISCSQQPDPFEDDRAMQQEVIRALIEENEALRDVNANLRREVVSLSENITRSQPLVDACLERYPALQVTAEIPSPAVHVPLTDIIFSQASVLINVQDLQAGIISGTNSMDPVLDEDNVVLEMMPESPAEVHAGDIIVFKQGDERIIHRVIRTGHDDAGWYAVTRGDNNAREDPFRVRFSDIQGVVVGVIY